MSLISSIRTFLPTFPGGKAADKPADIEMTAPREPSAGLPPGGVRDHAHHVESALTLLRGDADPPLADLLCSEVASDRRAGILKLEALVAPGGAASVLAGHGRASTVLAQLHHDGCVGRLPPPDDIRETLQSVADELGGIGEAPAEARQAALAIQGALRGKAGKTTADLLNSFRTDDRIAGNAKLDELLQHLQVLSAIHGRQEPGEQADDGTPSAPPEALVTELRQFVLAAGHAILPERRERLLECKSLGLPLQAWFEKCDALTASVSGAITALKKPPKAADGGPGREYPPPAGKSLAKVSEMAKAAREFSEAAAPQTPRRRRVVNHRTAVRGPVRALVRNMSREEAIELYRRMKQPECLALRALALRALAARQQVDEGSSDAATRIAAERQQLEEWLAAYTVLLESLAEYAELEPEDPFEVDDLLQSHAHAGALDATGASAEQVARAREMFKDTFGFGENPAPSPQPAPAS